MGKEKVQVVISGNMKNNLLILADSRQKYDKYIINPSNVIFFLTFEGTPYIFSIFNSLLFSSNLLKVIFV